MKLFKSTWSRTDIIDRAHAYIVLAVAIGTVIGFIAGLTAGIPPCGQH